MSNEDDLRREIAAGRVVCVVGAGVTIAATGLGERLSWSGVLRDLLRYVCEQAPIDDKTVAWLEQGIDAGGDATLIVTDVLISKVGGPKSPHFASWLRRRFGALGLLHPEVTDAICALGVPLVTSMGAE